MPSSCYVATVFRKRYPGQNVRYSIYFSRGLLSSCVFYGDLYPNEECFDETTSEKIGQLLLARKMFAYGSSKDYFQHRNCIGFVRMGTFEHPGCVVVMSNESPGLGYVLTACIVGMVC